MYNFEENSIIITNNSYKKELLKERKKLTNIKIITIKEFIDKYFFTYDNNAIYFLMEKYKLKYDIAKNYLDSLIYLNESNNKNNKIVFLKKIKNELEEKKLLIYDDYFKNNIDNIKIYFYKFNYFNRIEKYLVQKLNKTNNIEIVEKKYNDYQHIVYKANDLTEEVSFVALKIADLLKSGVPLTNIKITNIDEDYYSELERILSLYNLHIEQDNYLYSTPMSQDFLNNFKFPFDISYLKEKYSPEDINILVNTLNEYVDKTDVAIIKDMIENDLKNTKLKSDIKENLIKIIDYKEDYITDNDYVFMLNFNLNNIPKMKKDEDYLSDDIKSGLLIDTVIESNINEKKSTINNIKSIKNLIITYKEKTPFKVFYPSSLIDDMNLITKQIPIDYSKTYNSDINKIELTKKLDSLIKYGIKDESLDILYNNYQDIPYLTYSNKYTNISPNAIKEYLNYKLNLSYSSMSNYYKCSFKYYLSNILKLDIYEDNFIAYLGSMFHYCLEQGLQNEKSIDILINEFINNNKRELSNKELFFVNNIKEEIEFVLVTTKDNLKNTKLKDLLFEKEVEVVKDYNLKVTFKGFIDKIMYKTENDKTIVAIIDYKTGKTPFKLGYAPYGLNLQLPVYLYLTSNMKEFKNVYFAGFYINEVLNKEIVKDSKKTYLEQKKDLLKLHGYSNLDENIIKEFDPSYKDSNIIKSLKFNKSENFDSRSLIIDNEEISNLIALVDNKIKEASENIEKANFTINPKVTDKENLSCNFCSFKDICFKRKEDEIKIEEYKDLSFLKGE